MTKLSHKMEIYESLKRFGEAQWEQFSNPDFPFNDYAYLNAFEETGAAQRETGWIPQHLGLWDGERLIGASVLYLKYNSYGEYIFDWAWAEAYQQHGLAYFPKLVSAVPFTPATGTKLHFTKEANRAEVAFHVLSAAKLATESQQASSLHYLFLDPSEIVHFEREGFLIRHSFQYHWKNEGYQTFGDFLARLKSRKRKQILRERKEIAEQNLQIVTLTGSDLTPEHAKLFYSFYLSTIEKMGAIAYLSLEFFLSVFQNMPQEILLILAKDQETPIAGALYFQKGANLYGRYWGANREVKNLHFELCYYRPIEYAIARGLKLFEAGAQGEHKFARGFLPTLTYSAHWIRNPKFREAIARFIEEEKKEIASYFKNCENHTPYGNS